MARTRAQERARAIVITREYAPDPEAMVTALLVVLRAPAPKPRSTDVDREPVQNAADEAAS